MLHAGFVPPPLDEPKRRIDVWATSAPRNLASKDNTVGAIAQPFTDGRGDEVVKEAARSALVAEQAQADLDLNRELLARATGPSPAARRSRARWAALTSGARLA